ncbi:tRNA uridine-5-carboxymethylaminomethyl(34) synthesis GTPase MnmE [Rickettsia endosymbiont of Oedothorax gibbosus]|uniref:tRNA uridine-5-carboxymethylaminomethyl(34) synthesis GTPase MnmE n=1 Tax=Rickettsia endosymbiont of Oedothorax gibbosus TaxID=931099 RepID=UPI00202508FC|nr:tRNA uridine-5-carboxymethylaminomethyl(34) synthesis GTPase MnmE [Rickettsia endosymbiont of Oedothorax gibbosus]
METIFAQSSKPGKAGVAVFRISGSKSLVALKHLIKNDNATFIPRVMYCKKLINPKNQELIDEAVVAYFQAPASFTGEDVVEIYTHGSIAIAAMLTETLLTIEGLRMAEPGEFTRRAFLNGKFDLTAAEGIADLIEAETVWQHRQAVKQVGGELETLYNGWRQTLLTIIGLLEAYIDFPDEDIPQEILNRVMTLSGELKYAIIKHLDDNRRGELLRTGIKLTILGAPNVGKSSLLNFLMQRDVAIVSNIEGTTRDIIEGHLDIGGYPIILQDTAGIRDSNDLIELEGIKRAIESARMADIKIVMLDAVKLSNSPSLDNLIDDNTIILINKIDLLDDKCQIDICNNTLKKNYLKISIKDNIGMDSLLKEIENIAHNIAGLTETPHITRQRQRAFIEKALEYLKKFNNENFNGENDLVLATEDVRMAIRSLSNVTGKISVEEVLGEIFSNFCIGK